MNKIWANSGDSHVMEPADVWTSRLPAALAERTPKTVKDQRHETVFVDGQTVFRTLNQFSEAARADGAHDPVRRLVDLDNEGVMNQILFPSAGLWVYRMTDPELWAATAGAYNDWILEEIMSVSPRLVGIAMLPLLETVDAIAELQRAASMGFKAVMLSTTPPDGREYPLDVWEPFWDAAAEANMVLSFHVGTGADPRFFKGPGAVVTNYVETFIPGQRTVTHLTASGVLDRHPDLKIFIAEGGASWVPSLADRLDEGYRQHNAFATPKLTRLPSESIFSQVYASFQHDVSAIPAFDAMKYPNVLWGDDYPHLEGTFGHTQKTLHELFDGVAPATTQSILRSNFDRLLGTTTVVPAA
jgi:predicted TIM-barrel fold metal-dependent hydrolase